MRACSVSTGPASTGHCPACDGTKHTLRAAVDARKVVSGYAAPAIGIEVGHLLPRTGQIELRACGDCALQWYAPGVVGDAAFYGALQRHSWYYQSAKPEYAFARAFVRAGDRVLEVGCGRGAFRETLPADLSYRGLEFSPDAVVAARSAGLDVVDRPIEVEADMRPATYDVVCHFQVLEHVQQPLAFMAACVRALRPGGRLIVAVPSEDSFMSHAESVWLNMPPHHLTRWTDDALGALFRRLQLQIADLWHEPVADYHRGWHRRVVINSAWKALLGRRPGLVGSALGSAVTKVLARTPLGEWLYARGLRSTSKLAYGHSICVVGEKA